jgi:hypothetical protein
MKELIKIGEKEITKIEYKSIPVVTFNMIDELHQRAKGTAKRTFSYNKKRFIINKDFFTEKKEKLMGTKFVLNSKEGNPNIEVVLLSERGYLKLVKSFRDDLSWKIQDILIESYFKIKQYTKKEMNRLVSKEVRKSLTDAIQESGLNDKMHGFAYKNFTDLAYKLVLGMPAKKYKQTNNIDGNLRDSLNKFQLKLVSKLEDVMKDFIELGLNYQQIKQMILVTLPDVQKKNIKIESNNQLLKENIKEIPL